MKITLLFTLLLALASCADLKNNTTDNFVANQPTPKTKKIISPKRAVEAKKENTGVLISGVEYEVSREADGIVITFDPSIAKNDEVFVKAATQIIAKLYNDKINDESHISIESNIDYTIFKGTKSRYRIVPSNESNGEISSISITSIP